MFYLILLIEIFLFGLVFYRLVTTNHWTIGKKLLVGLSASIVTETLGMFTAMSFNLLPIVLVIVKLPIVIVGLLMVYFFYRNDIIVH